MKFRWVVVLAVVMAVVWWGNGLAGPRRPAGGDPDTPERAKPVDPYVTERDSGFAGGSVSVDFVVFKTDLRQHVTKIDTTSKVTRLPAMSGPVDER